MNSCSEKVTVYYPAVPGSPVSLYLTFGGYYTHTNLKALALVFRFFSVMVGDTKKNWRSTTYRRVRKSKDLIERATVFTEAFNSKFKKLWPEKYAIIDLENNGTYAFFFIPRIGTWISFLGPLLVKVDGTL